MGFATSTFSMVSGFCGPWNTAAFMDGSFLRQEVADENAGSRRDQELDEGLGAQDLPRSVAPAERRRRVRDRPSVDSQNAIDQVHDPVVVQASAGVEAALVLPVEGQARLRDLDDERRPRGMLTAVAPTSAARDRDVGLWLGLVVELDGTLRPHQPARLERSAESVLHEPDRRVVGAVLGLALDELAAQQFEGLVRAEDADVDQALVLHAGPAPRAGRIRRHEGDATSHGGRRQCVRSRPQAAHARPSGSRSTASPAAVQPLKPPSRWATLGNPISRSTSAASAERWPPAQYTMMRFIGSTLPV